jgi:hypothetical protein
LKGWSRASTQHQPTKWNQVMIPPCVHGKKNIKDIRNPFFVKIWSFSRICMFGRQSKVQFQEMTRNGKFTKDFK